MQFAQANYRAADFAVRVVDILKTVFEALNGVFGQFHQGDRSIGF